MVYGRQVDGFSLDGAQLGRHLHPQLVAAHPQRLNGARFHLGSNSQASRPLLPQFLTRCFPLLHDVARQVGPPDETNE